MSERPLQKKHLWIHHEGSSQRKRVSFRAREMHQPLPHIGVSQAQLFLVKQPYCIVQGQRFKNSLQARKLALVEVRIPQGQVLQQRPVQEPRLRGDEQGSQMRGYKYLAACWKGTACEQRHQHVLAGAVRAAQDDDRPLRNIDVYILQKIGAGADTHFHVCTTDWERIRRRRSGCDRLRRCLFHECRVGSMALPHNIFPACQISLPVHHGNNMPQHRQSRSDLVDRIIEAHAICTNLLNQSNCGQETAQWNHSFHHFHCMEHHVCTNCQGAKPLQYKVCVHEECALGVDFGPDCICSLAEAGVHLRPDLK
mmetsp:Transcript_136348/g.339997  ORF Transcript_136348/g.339997 Transcript_136348/m.339997 type:complete len:310 (-) Transcript_136348:737-1666(-)